MKQIKWIAFVLLIIGCIMLLARCGNENERSKPPKANPEAENKNAPKIKFHLTPEEVSTFHLNFVQAAQRPIIKTYQIPVILSRDQTKTIPISSNLPGKIDEVYVAGIGSIIKQGQALFKISSQELVEIQQKYINDLNQINDASVDQSKALQEMEELKNQLFNFGFPQEDLDLIIQNRSPFSSFTIFTKTGGVVKSMHLTPGTHVNPEDVLLIIQDVSHASAKAYLPADTVEHLHRGIAANLYLKRYPAQSFSGTLTSIDIGHPDRDSNIPITFNFDSLFPMETLEQNAEVVIQTNLGTYLSIPKEAVFKEEGRTTVYVLNKSGEIAIRTVQIGVEGDVYTQVNFGLEKGETVIANPQILLAPR